MLAPGALRRPWSDAAAGRSRCGARPAATDTPTLARNIKIALRRLRKFARTGAPEELLWEALMA